MDRFGLRVLVRGLEQPAERLEAYRRARAYRLNPRALAAQFDEETRMARDEILAARDLLVHVDIPEEVTRASTLLIQNLGIDSLRAEITLFEAARAYAAADARTQVNITDIQTIAPLALRLRHSPFMIQYFHDQQQEEQRLTAQLNAVMDAGTKTIEEGNHGE
jgi:magnesium chelatase subunit I